MVGVGGDAETLLNLMKKPVNLPEGIPVRFFFHLTEDGLLMGFPGGVGIGDDEKYPAKDAQPDEKFKECFHLKSIARI